MHTHTPVYGTDLAAALKGPARNRKQDGTLERRAGSRAAKTRVPMNWALHPCSEKQQVLAHLTLMSGARLLSWLCRWHDRSFLFNVLIKSTYMTVLQTWGFLCILIAVFQYN